MPRDIRSELAAPFEDSDIEWRLQWTDDVKNTGRAVPYVTNRAIQNRLDNTVGAANWKNEFVPWHGDGKKAAQLCGISIYFDDRKEWITKYDGAEDSDIESVKGGLSDSMKRAAVQWGIGRYLYSMDSVYVDTEKPGKTTFIAKSSQSKLDGAHQRVVRKLFGAGQADSQNPQPPATPKSIARQPQAEAPEKAVEQPASPPVSAPSPAEQHPVGTSQRNMYCVIKTTPQMAMSGENTLLQLKGTDDKVILAYMQGTNPSIKPDVWITDAVITHQESQGVVFYTLDSFAFAGPRAA